MDLKLKFQEKKQENICDHKLGKDFLGKTLIHTRKNNLTNWISLKLKTSALQKA